MGAAWLFNDGGAVSLHGTLAQLSSDDHPDNHMAVWNIPTGAEGMITRTTEALGWLCLLCAVSAALLLAVLGLVFI